jgi:cell pole-organizing protein PopZ
LLDEAVADSSRHSLETLSTIAATAPAQPPVNPLEEMIRELLRPILKQWLDDHLPGIVDEHVKREITRITGRPL